MRTKLSAFVITYNRAWLLETCLRAVAFADEVIVVDKSSTDGSASLAMRHADRVEVVPWSPVVEETREMASSLCRHDHILFLDDDEILSPKSGPFIMSQLEWKTADIHAIPYRHYILGVHDERSYYWPETRHCLFRKGAIEFRQRVHGGVFFHSDRVATIPVSSGVCIHHLSHPDVASFLERTNRYTSCANRERGACDDTDISRYAHERIDYWQQRSEGQHPGGYPAAVGLLRAVYDIVDRLKSWEEHRGLDGAALLRAAATALSRDQSRSEPVD